MKKLAKILLGVVTIWPLLYMAFFFVVMLSTFSSMPLHGRPPDAGAFEDFFSIIFTLHILNVLLTMGLTLFYIVNVFKNNRIAQDKKTLWAVVLFMANVMAMPVYWYLYIWPEEEGTHAASNERQALHSADASGWANEVRAKEARGGYVPPPQPPDWR